MTTTSVLLLSGLCAGALSGGEPGLAAGGGLYRRPVRCRQLRGRTGGASEAGRRQTPAHRARRGYKRYGEQPARMCIAYVASK